MSFSLRTFGFSVIALSLTIPAAAQEHDGVDFSIWRGLAIGPNITFMKFLGNRDTDLTRIGARASYRF